MALTAQEKIILRKAICEGAFNVNQIRNVTPDLLELVSNKTDDEIRAILTTYKSGKISKIDADIIKLQSQKDELNA